MKKHLFFAFILAFLVACNDDEKVNPGYGIELYLLESFKTIPNQTYFMIDESTVITYKNPLITYSEIDSYDPVHYIFHILDKGKSAISDLEHSVSGKAFAVKVDNNLIYTGYFWPGFSSRGCDRVVIDPMGLSRSNEIHVRLGYPGRFDGVEIPDNRNDQLILDILKRDYKLIE